MTDFVKHTCVHARTNWGTQQSAHSLTTYAVHVTLYPLLCFPNLLKFEKKILNNQSKIIIIRKNVLKAFKEQLCVEQVMDGVN